MVSSLPHRDARPKDGVMTLPDWFESPDDRRRDRTYRPKRRAGSESSDDEALPDASAKKQKQTRARARRTGTSNINGERTAEALKAEYTRKQQEAEELRAAWATKQQEEDSKVKPTTCSQRITDSAGNRNWLFTFKSNNMDELRRLSAEDDAHPYHAWWDKWCRMSPADRVEEHDNDFDIFCAWKQDQEE